MTQTTPLPIRVVLVDDHPLFRAGMRWALRADPAIDVVGEADHVTAALRVIARTEPSVVIIDAHLQGLTGLMVAQMIHRQFPAARIILLVAQHTDARGTQAREAGVARCVAKDLDAAALAAVIHAVAEAPPERRRPLPPPTTKPCPLSSRELEILDAVAQGLTNAEIAQILVVSDATVKNQITSLMRKLGVHSRTAALMVALREGWMMLGDDAPFGPPGADHED